jgi:hypothetical protein
VNAHRPIAIPNGVVMAKRIDNVGFSQLRFHDSYVDGGGRGESDTENSEDGNEGNSEAGGGGRAAIRIPSERPSKS